MIRSCTVGWVTKPLYSRRQFNTKMFKDIVNVFQGKPTLMSSTRSLFFQCKSQSSKPSWHHEDFRSKQTLQVLHVWMLHRRLIMLGGEGTLLDEALYDELWEETSRRIRALGVGEMSLNKHLTEVQGHSLRCCVELDEALSHEPDEEEVVGRIGGVVWRYVFDKSEAVPDEHVMRFAQYIRQEQLSLMDVPDQAVLDGRLAFDAAPFDRPVSEEEARLERERVEREGVWLTELDVSGKPFYWNTKTHKRQWDRPL